MDNGARPEIPEPLPEQNKGFTRIDPVLRWLVEPDSPTPESTQDQGYLLPTLILLLALGLGAIFSVLFIDSVFRAPGQLIVLVTLFLLLGIAYSLSRTKYHPWAALLAVSLSALAGWPFATTDGSVAFSCVIISILVSGLILSWRATALLAVLQLSGISLWAIRSPYDITPSELSNLVTFVGMVSILAAITAFIRQRNQDEIRRQSLSLRTSEELFHLVSYATSDVVWDWDLATGQVWRNQGVQRLFGFQIDQVGPEMGWWQGRIHPDDQEKVVRSLHEAIDNGEKFWSKEYRFQRFDGNYADVFDRAYVIQDESGKPVRLLGAIMDITARKRAEEVLREEAIHDPLTGLFNRRYMEEMLDQETLRTDRLRRPISIIMLDIDYFKQVNDTFGHAAGDAMLHKLGSFLLKNIRGTDIACRYGGDEFVLILPNASLKVAQQRAEILCQGARDLHVELYGQPAKAFTLSLGVATFPDHGATREALLKAADAALYNAKAAGRDQVFVTGQ
jgi:diguanylate cyclase (GGDEF)-like protein/PAS domain S-box-containing protein